MSLIELRKAADGSGDVFFPLSDDIIDGLRIKVGSRLVWTVAHDTMTVRKRTKRYKLRENEHDSFVENSI